MFELLKLEDPEYHKRKEISQSQLKTFMDEPRDYEYYYMGEYRGSGVESKAVGLGSATHKYYLEKEEFWNTYYYADFKMPVNKQQENFINAVFDPEFPRDVVTAYSNFYSVTGKSKAAIEAAAKGLFDTMAGYGKYLKESNGRLVLEPDVWDEVQTLHTHAQYHTIGSKYLFGIEENLAYENEFALIWKSPDSDLLLRCKIDRLIIDLENKKATVIDYKTSRAVSVKQFIYSIRKYKYHIQADFYKSAIEVYLFDLYGTKFDVEFLFIPQNTTRHREILGVVELSKSDLQMAHTKWTEALFDLETCMIKNDFETHPKDFSGKYTVEVFDPNYGKVEEVIKSNLGDY